MKKITGIAVLLLALLQILCCFSACKDRQTPTESETEGGNAIFELTREALAQYTIVTPRQTTENMDMAANHIQSSVKDLTGVELEIKDDFIIEGSADFCETEYEILIGYTNRKECYSFYSDVKKNDSGYALVGKKILILGYSSVAVKNSAIAFNIDVLNGAPDKGAIMSSDDNKIISEKYAWDTVLLNGTSINKYRIIYPSFAMSGENEIAAYIQSYITDKTGYVLKCESDESEISEYEIQIGETSRITDSMCAERDGAGYSAEHTYIGKIDNGIWLYGNGRSGMYVAMERLISSMNEGDKNITLDVPASVCEPIKGLDLSVMSYNVYYDLSDTKRDPDDVIVSVKQRSPDIFGLNESGMDWIEKFNDDTEISAAYGCAEGKAADKTSGASYNPIFYRKDKFELIEVGTKWLSATPDKMSKYPDAAHYKIFTYAILKDKASGVELMYINVHFDGSNDGDTHAKLDQVRKDQAEVLKSFAQEYTYLPIVIGGDFNEKPTSSVIRGMSSGTRFKYCMDVANEKIDIGATKKVNSKFELLSPENCGVLDYMFVTADSVTVRKYEQFDNIIDGKYPSDHLPVCAEVTVKY